MFPFPRLVLVFLLSLGAFAQADPLPAYQWAGDIRYRINKGHEAIDQDRIWQQLRVRLGFNAPVNDSVQAVVRLMTATSPISGNQTLGDSGDPGMARRTFGLDLAYMDWKFAAAAKVWAGRTANPFWAPNKSQIIFDHDLTFEGVAVKFEPQSEHLGFFVNLAGFILAENYAAPDDLVDTGLAGGDVGLNIKYDSFGRATVHAGYYEYLNIQDKAVSSVEKGAKRDDYSYPYYRYRGNTVYPNDAAPPTDFFFVNKYRLAEVGAEWNRDFSAVNVGVFADVVRNTAIGRFNFAKEFGATLKWNILSFTAAHVKKESDSTVATFTDSDMNGGGTDNQGERYAFGVTLGKNAQFVLTQYYAKRGVDSVKRNFVLTQCDFAVTF